MTTSLIPGQSTWECERDEEGHRTYRITHKVRADPLDGPAIVLQTPGLPTVGSFWVVDNDVDLFAWCRPTASVRPVIENEPNRHWLVTQTFSTKPPDRDKQRCGDTPIEDPLLEPPKISGTFVKYTEEAYADVLGRPITNSAHELIRGPKVEFDRNRPQVRIELNSGIQLLPIFAPLIDAVNATPMWGLPPRCVKLSNVSWERRYRGVCQVYYTYTFEFDINYETFDRLALDYAESMLNGHWDRAAGTYVLDDIGGAPPNPANPAHFIQAHGPDGNVKPLVLDGAGKPYFPPPPAIATVTPATLCEVASQNDNHLMSMNKEYGNFTLVRPQRYHYFRTYAGARRKVTVESTDPFVDRDLFRNLTIGLNLYNDDCTRVQDTGDTLYTDDTAYIRGQAKPGSDFIIIEVENRSDSASFEYKIKVEGKELQNLPGRILIAKYPETDFLILGIPAIL